MDGTARLSWMLLPGGDYSRDGDKTSFTEATPKESIYFEFLHRHQEQWEYFRLSEVTLKIIQPAGDVGHPSERDDNGSHSRGSKLARGLAVQVRRNLCSGRELDNVRLRRTKR
eukprot:gene26413-biopygen3425